LSLEPAPRAYQLISPFGFNNIRNKYSYLKWLMMCNSGGGAVYSIGSKLKAEGSKQKSDPQIKYYPQITPISAD